jgi:hypothetical protein
MHMIQTIALRGNRADLSDKAIQVSRHMSTLWDVFSRSE